MKGKAMSAIRGLDLSAGVILSAALLAGCAGTRIVEETAPVPTRTASAPEVILKPELGDYFKGADGAFTLYDLNRNQYLRYNPERCAERFLPASTFKILNSLIGLETGVIPDENYVIPWDGTQYDFPSWNRDQTLKTAIRDSVVWYYQELARRVGRERMQSYVDAADYGNRDISGPIDSFWLNGALRISADEQVDFLMRLFRDELPFSARSMEIVREILVLEKTGTFSFSGKTGSVQRIAPHVGWFVGYLETAGDVYFLAVNFESANPDGYANGAQAKDIAWNILRGINLLP
jgi:beta-lactamase class D